MTKKRPYVYIVGDMTQISSYEVWFAVYCEYKIRRTWNDIFFCNYRIWFIYVYLKYMSPWIN